MAALTLVTGAAGSGKTQRLVDLAAAHYAADAFAPLLVLVPTTRHADQFRQRLVRDVRVALGLEVTTLALFARRAARRASAALTAPEVAAELLRRVTRDRIAGGGAARFAPISGTPGLHGLIAQAAGDLAAEGVDAAALRDAAGRSGDPDLAALADIYAAYRAALDERGWREPREAATVAAAAVARGGVTAPGLVLVDGVQFLRPGEAELVAALAGQADVHLAIDPEAGERAAWTVEALRARVPGARTHTLAPRALTPSVEASSAADAEAQLREIARSIKTRLTEDRALRPSDFAVVFRQVTPHLTVARRVFREYDLPLDPAAGERLSTRPFGIWLLRLLRLGAHGWRAQHLADVIRSGFLDRRRWRVAPDTADHIANAARRHRFWSGREALTSLVAALGADAGAAERSPAYAARLLAAHDALGAMLPDLDAWLAPEPATPAVHAAALDAALFGAPGVVRAAVEGYDGLDMDIRAVRAELAAFRAVEESLGEGPVTFDAFVDALADRMERPATLLREAGGVLLAPAHTLHGLRFRHVYAGGLAEGEFPAPHSSASLLDRRKRERLRDAGLGLPPDPRATEDELWAAVRTRADAALSLWRPRLNASGRPVAASYYFAQDEIAPRDVPLLAPPEATASRPELAVALVRRWRDGEHRRPRDLDAWPAVRAAAPVEQLRRSFEVAGRFEGRIASVDLPYVLGPDVPWSASRIDAYRECPFQFFAHYTLRLSEVDEEMETADAATRGTVVHEILAAAVADLVEEALPLDETTIERAVARMREAGPGIWDSAPERHAFGRAGLWRYERDETLDRIESLLRSEAARWWGLGVTRISRPEQELTTHVPGVDPPLRLLARIDRLDLGDGVARVVDYKSGREIRESDVRSGQRVQLRWYALAARLTGAERVVARYAYLRPGIRAWGLDTSVEADREAVEGMVDLAREVRSSVAAGRFDVRPAVDVCPRYCAYIHACRVNNFSRSKEWPA